jgi:DNA polymerase III delta prime subunit
MTANHRTSTELTLLAEVEAEVTSRLAQSLHNSLLIPLEQQTQSNQVIRLWDIELRTDAKPGQRVLPWTNILEFFDDSKIAGRLLILGEPGSGKTTTLLTLAQGLLQRAKDDATYPMPILLDLSSWASNSSSISTWLVEEVELKYGLNQDLAIQWRQERKLLPLFDGLDEVKPELQATCVEELNDWLDGWGRGLPIAICCRQEEYEKVVWDPSQSPPSHPEIAEFIAENAGKVVRLQLNRSIQLRSLENWQIQSFLTRANHPELWHRLQQDSNLLELLRTPLWLNMAMICYNELPTEQWQQLTTKQRVEQLLDIYVQKMLHLDLGKTPYSKHKPPTAQQARHWLTILAKQMQAASQTEFSIDNMQPLSWLRTNLQKRGYKLIHGLTYGLLPGLIYGLAFGLTYSLILPLILTPIIGLIIGLILMLLPLPLGTITPVAAIRFSLIREMRRETLERLQKLLIAGLIPGLIVGLFYGGWIVGLASGLVSGLVSGLFYGLIYGLFVELYRGSKNHIERRIHPNQGIWNSARNAVFILGISFAIVLAIIFLLPELLSLLGSTVISQERIVNNIISIISTPIWVAVSLVGGQACVQHFALRYALFHSNDAPWNYARFLDYCTDRLFLQRIGGRYRFIHKLLQDHFAKMEL